MDGGAGPDGGPRDHPDGGGGNPEDAAVDEPDPVGCQDIVVELNYLASASWSAGHPAFGSTPKKADAAYGAISDFRIDKAGAESVHPGRSALAAIGMMEGLKALGALHCDDTNRKNQQTVVDAFFLEWLSDFSAAAGSDADAGVGDGGAAGPLAGMPNELRYDNNGALIFTSDEVSLLATAQVLVAMTKYVEVSGNEGFREANFGLALDLANALVDKMDPTTKLVTDGTTARVEDNAFAALALRNFAGWTSFSEQSSLRPTFMRHAADIEEALQTFKDGTTYDSFMPVREAGAAASYAGFIDLPSSIAPYYSESVAAAEPFSAAASTFWTNGKAWTTPLTVLTDGPNLYGTRLQVFESSNPEIEQRLYASASLKLARMDWLAYQITNNPEYKARAQGRLAFVRDKSGLWYGNPLKKEGNAEGGILEWRNDTTNANTPDTAKRYVDVSADFIMDTAMIALGQTMSFQTHLDASRQYEAEDFVGQKGLGTEACTDTGGGKNVKDVGNGEWAHYEGVNLDGVRSFQARVAAANDGYVGTIEFHKGSVTGSLMGTCRAPLTGDWQNWTTISCSASDTSGTTLYLEFFGGHEGDQLPNINWFSLMTSDAREAESFDDQDKLKLLQSADKTISKLGSAGNGDWAQFDHINFQGISQFVARMASGSKPGTLEFRLNDGDGVDKSTGTLLASCQMNTTDLSGKSDRFQTTYCPAKQSSGAGTLIIVWKGDAADTGLPELDWFQMQ
jgi:hypothetical protein